MAHHSQTEKAEKTQRTEAQEVQTIVRRGEEPSRVYGRPLTSVLGTPITSPFSMMRRLMDDMDRLMSGLTLDLPTMIAPLGAYGLLDRPRETAWSPVVEAFDRDGKLVFRADLPGLEHDDVNVEIQGDQLVICGEREQDKEETVGGRHYTERRYGSFERRFTLPEGAVLDTIEATFDNGVLEIAIEVPCEAKPAAKRIEIKPGRTSTKDVEGEGPKSVH
jgi:HSP20 family protein